MLLWPTRDLEQLCGLGLGLHAGHQLCQRNHFLIDFENPRLDVRVVVVRHHLDGEDGPELLFLHLFVRPKGRICLPFGDRREDKAIQLI